MADNVFKFRTLKWGDPDEKLKLLPEEQKRALPRVEIGLLAFIAVSLAVCGWYLI